MTAPSVRVASTAAAKPRSVLRSVAVPTEHGGWGLTLEPALLGLLVAPSAAGAFLAVAAMVAFLARTPLKVVLVDRRRSRHLERTTVAAVVFGVELVIAVALVIGAAVLADGAFWVPALVAAPLVVLELWFDMRSRSRRTVPEVAGSVGICAVAAMIVQADGDSARLAAAVWVVLAARALTAIPFVRSQIARLHDRPVASRVLLATDAGALAATAIAVVLEPSVVAGAVAVLAIVVIQRVTARRPVPRPAVLGVRQLALGGTVVAATAIGVLVA